jgi:uncharacterized protein YbcI
VGSGPGVGAGPGLGGAGTGSPGIVSDKVLIVCAYPTAAVINILTTTGTTRARRAALLMLQDETEPEPLTSQASFAPALEISNGISRVHKENIGRGPTSARTTVDGDLVVCLLEGGYTRAEHTLEENENTDLVAQGRLGLQEAMRDGLIAVVEQALGRTVRSFMSATDVESNFQVEAFVLESSAES